MKASLPPKISVVMPTYNQAEFLPAALDGIFTQRLQDFELIVVNDGSTDQTEQILNEYHKKHAFILINQTNQKLPGALNTGFSQARGQYLTWTSSDNITLPGWLEVMSKYLDENPGAYMVYSDWEVIDENDNSLGILKTFDYDPFLLMRVNYIQASFMYRRTCQERLGLYNPEYIYAEDWEYWIRISRCFPIVHIPEVLYQYRYHRESLTLKYIRSQKKKQSPGYNKLHKDFLAQPLRWYFSKLKWELLKMKLGKDPKVFLLPKGLGLGND